MRHVIIIMTAWLWTVYVCRTHKLVGRKSIQIFRSSRKGKDTIIVFVLSLLF